MAFSVVIALYSYESKLLRYYTNQAAVVMEIVRVTKILLKNAAQVLALGEI
ncbi:MAG: hypothetical protein ACFB16_24725 [Phormidesmis sp.]